LRRACRALFKQDGIYARSDEERARMIRAAEAWVARHPESLAPDSPSTWTGDLRLNRVGRWKARKGYHVSQYRHCTVGAI
jgi:hypothetical protein